MPDSSQYSGPFIFTEPQRLTIEAMLDGEEIEVALVFDEPLTYEQATLVRKGWAKGLEQGKALGRKGLEEQHEATKREIEVLRQTCAISFSGKDVGIATLIRRAEAAEERERGLKEQLEATRNALEEILDRPHGELDEHDMRSIAHAALNPASRPS